MIGKIIKAFSRRNNLVECGLCGASVKEKHAGKLIANTAEGQTDICMCRECTITIEHMYDQKNKG